MINAFESKNLGQKLLRMTAAVKKLKTLYSAGVDGLPSVILCCSGEVLATQLCPIFNTSFMQGICSVYRKQPFVPFMLGTTLE